MKGAVLGGVPLAAGVRRWALLLGEYAVWQPGIQLVGIAAGLVLVNALPTAEYALYTLASAAVTMQALLCDLGITNSLAYFRREAERRQEPFAGYVRAAFALRRGLFAASAPAVALGFAWLAWHSGFGVTATAPAAVLVLAAAWLQTDAGVRLAALRLGGRLRAGYAAELAGAVVRLAGALAIAMGSARWAVLALASNALGALATARAGGALPAAGTDRAPDARRRIVRYLLPTLPSALYFAFQGALLPALGALFGGPRTVAEVGALGRLGLVMGLFNGLIPWIFVPRLAGVASPGLYRTRYAQYGAALAAVAAGLVALSWLWPGPLLILLGRDYRHLEPELVLVMAAAAVALLAAYGMAVNQVRGWVRWQPVDLALFASAQVAFMLLLPMDSTSGVLTWSLACAAVGLAAQLATNLVGLWRPDWVGVERC